MFKRVLSLSLSIVMLVSLVNISVLASDIGNKADDVGCFKEVLGAFDISNLPTISVSGGNNTVDRATEQVALFGTRKNADLKAPNQTVLMTGISGNTTSAYTDADTGNTYGVYSRERISAVISNLDEKIYPGIKNTDATKVYQFTQTNGDAYIFRFHNMLCDGAMDDVAAGDQVTITIKAYYGDVKSHASYTTSDGVEVEEGDGKDIKYLPVRLGFRQSTEGATSSTTGTDWVLTEEELVPVNTWYTIAYTFTVTEDDADKFDTVRGVFIKAPGDRNKEVSVKNPYAGSVFMHSASISVFKDTSKTHLDYVNYTEDYEDVDLKLEKDFDAQIRATGVIGSGTQYIGASKNYRYGEEKIFVNSSYNKELSTSTYDVDGNSISYTYTPSRTPSASKVTSGYGRYHTFGTSTNNLNSFTDSCYKNTRRKPSAHEYALSETKDETGTRLITTYAHSGTKAVMFSGRGHVNGAMRFENIFGFNPTAVDKNRRFRISFYIYPDSTQGGYSGGSNDVKYAATYDKITPTIDVYMNGPTSSGYSYRNNSDLNVVNDMVLQWDKWNKVEFEWTVGNCYDNGETTSNPLANCLTIREAKAGNIVDTYFIDDLSVKEITPNVRIYSSDDEIPSVNAVIGSMADIDAETAVLLIASYDADGMLVEVKQSDVMDLTKGFPVKSTGVTLSEKATKYIAFIWESKESGRPFMKQQNIVAKNPLDGKKFIFIGNSFTYYGKTVDGESQSVDRSVMASRFNDMGYFYNLCKLNGADVSVTNWTWGGHSLTHMFSGSCSANRGHDGHDHLADLRALSDMNYDYVIVQPGSGKDWQVLRQQIELVQSVFKETNPDTKFVLSAHHSYYNNRVEGQLELVEDKDAITAELKEIANENNMTYVNWGEIVNDIMHGYAKVENSKIPYSQNTFIVTKSKDDGYHENMLTGYITTQAVYSAITGTKAYGQEYSFCTDTNVNSHFSVSAYLDKYYTYDNVSPSGSATKLSGDDLTTFPEVFKSESDMRGIQKLIDAYLGR